MDLKRYQRAIRLATSDPTMAKLLRKYEDANMVYLKAQSDYDRAHTAVENYLGVDEDEPDQAS